MHEEGDVEELQVLCRGEGIALLTLPAADTPTDTARRTQALPGRELFPGGGGGGSGE
mgnify:CR=1 FL=1